MTVPGGVRSLCQGAHNATLHTSAPGFAAQFSRAAKTSPARPRSHGQDGDLVLGTLLGTLDLPLLTTFHRD